MLKLSLKPGEYIDIGENIRVVSMKQKDKKEYYREQTISEEAKREIAGILMREKHAASEITERPAAKKAIYTVSHRR